MLMEIFFDNICSDLMFGRERLQVLGADKMRHMCFRFR
jgi:hypothetical protein